MPPKRANNRKQPIKAAAASSADAEVLNNDVKELGEVISTDLKSIANGSAEALEEEPKEALKTTKRVSGRAKNSAPTEVEQTLVDKKPAAKEKGKKKTKEIEVIQKENEAEQDINVEVKEELETEAVEETTAEEEITTKPSGKGARKKSKTDTKKAKASKVTKKMENIEENAKDEQIAESIGVEKSAKKLVGKRKNQNVTDKEVENVEVKQEVLDETPVAKATKKSSKGNKKAASDSLDVVPKKRGKSSPKVKAQAEDQTEALTSETNSIEIKIEAKKEKKPTKRGRNAAKPAVETEDATASNNGDAVDEVLPKKRSRIAVNDDKEAITEKPKKGRGKKTEKVSDNVVKEEPEENDIETNGDIKAEKMEIKASLKPNKKAAKKAETMDSTSTAAEPATKARGGSRKRAAPSTNKKSKTSADDKMDDGEDKDNEDEADGDSKPSKTKKKKDTSAGPLNPTDTRYIKEEFELAPLGDGETAEEPRYNFKISSWNVAGLRSWLKKEGMKFLEYEQPDIFCMQEIKCTTDQLPEEVERIPGYHPYWLCMPGGYAGVAIYSKIMPINVEYGIGNEEFDNCGRIITAEYEKFFLINVYVPNSGRKLVNLDARMKWEKLFQEFVKSLDARKPVVICGDMNVSHQEIDLANPKANTRNAGFTKEERDKMSELLALGYIDTFRHLYPERKGAYTFWTYMGNARARNVGWRLDYFIVSKRFIKRVVDNCIRTQCMGSDHCPITLFMKL